MGYNFILGLYLQIKIHQQHTWRQRIKRLSQSERDEVLLKEAKEEGLFKIELRQAVKESYKVFADAMSDMSKSE